MGFATLPNQVHRKSVKKGFDFTLMVAGNFNIKTKKESECVLLFYRSPLLVHAEIIHVSQTFTIRQIRRSVTRL